MTDNGFIVQSAIPERLYVKVYHDFLDSTIVTGKEKLVFILLKRYLNFKYDESGIAGEVYPTLETISKQAGMSRKTVADIIKKLETKGLIEVKQQGLNRPNIYTLRDFSGIWKSKTEIELNEAVKSYNDDEEFMMIQTLRSRGYTVTKEKGPDKLSADQSQDNTSSTDQNHICQNHNTGKQFESQVEQYTIEDIKAFYDYDIMINDKPLWKDDIDNIMEIIRDVLNCKKPTVRVAGEDKPTAVVIGKFKKLTYSEILYVLENFSRRTDRIGHQRNYLITMLYTAKEQMNFDISNQVQHDMYNWKSPTE